MRCTKAIARTMASAITPSTTKTMALKLFRIGRSARCSLLSLIIFSTLTVPASNPGALPKSNPAYLHTMPFVLQRVPTVFHGC